jgi:hypothetical protein
MKHIDVGIEIDRAVETILAEKVLEAETALPMY